MKIRREIQILQGLGAIIWCRALIGLTSIVFFSCLPIVNAADKTNKRVINSALQKQLIEKADKILHKPKSAYKSRLTKIENPFVPKIEAPPPPPPPPPPPEKGATPPPPPPKEKKQIVLTDEEALALAEKSLGPYSFLGLKGNKYLLFKNHRGRKKEGDTFAIPYEGKIYRFVFEEIKPKEYTLRINNTRRVVSKRKNSGKLGFDSPND